MKKLLMILALAAAPLLGHAAGSGFPLDAAPNRATDLAALQNGAKLFVNYCLNCHSASMMRYNRLRDIGLTEEQIKQSLLFTADKVGEPMKIAMNPKDAKEWFGKTPPDLSLITRAKSSIAPPFKGEDYVYTFLRTYYRDAAIPHGWNNLVLTNAAMPHVFWERQGPRELTKVEIHHATNDKGEHKWERVTSTYDVRGQKTVTKDEIPPISGQYQALTVKWDAKDPAAAAQYDKDVADLVGFLKYMSDPSANQRQRLGVWVLLFLGIFAVVAWWLNSVFWRDIK
jgi:ubiquinol-cytochrome c reductase cytochrome c1 subunit